MHRENNTSALRQIRTRRTRMFRLQLLEVLEQRVVYAADTSGVLSSLSAHIEGNPTALLGPVSATGISGSKISSMGAQPISAEHQSAIDNALKLRALSSGSSKLVASVAPSNLAASSVQRQLIRSPFTTAPDLSDPNNLRTITPLSSTTPLAMAFSNATTVDLSAIAHQRGANIGSTATRRVPSDGRMTQPVQWVGAYCTVDGEQIHPNSVMMTLPLGEGEGEDASESIVPELDVPELEFTSYTGALNDFTPSQQTGRNEITSFGLFTASSLMNPDFTLPGLNWVRQVDQTWVSAEWSITEIFVMSFRLTNSNDSTDSQATTLRSLRIDSGDEDLPPEDDQGLSLDIDTTKQSIADRYGFYTLVFHASRGITTPADAGVKWSVNESYSDTIELSETTAVETAYAPEVYDVEIHGGTQLYENDYSGNLSVSDSSQLTVSSSGGNSFSSTPSLNSSNDTTRSLSANIDYNASGTSLGLSGWQNTSSTGNIAFQNQTGTSIAALQSVMASLYPDVSFPTNPQDLIAEYRVALDDEDYLPGARIDDLGEIDGNGTLSASGGTSTSGRSGVSAGSVNLLATLTNGNYDSLLGTAMNQMNGAKEDSGKAAGTFVFNETEEVLTLLGPETTTVRLFAGWKGQDSDSATADAGLHVDITLGTEEIEYSHDDTDGKQEGEVTGGSHAGVDDFIEIFLTSQLEDVVDTTYQDQYGDHSVTGSMTRTRNLWYSQENAGSTLGDVTGLANLENVGSEFDSDIYGFSREILVQEYIEDWDRIDLVEATSEVFFNGTGSVYMYEKLRSISEVIGTASASRAGDGPLVVNMDVEAVNSLSVDYTDDEAVYEYNNPGGCILACAILYDWTRSASLNGKITNTTTITGSASVDPESASGDSGGFTTVESSQYEGDDSLNLVVTGTTDGGPERRMQREKELEMLLGIFEESEEDNSGYGDSGYGGYGGGSGGGGTGSGPGNIPGVSEPTSMFWGVTTGFFKGLVQGAANVVNGVQDAAVGLANLPVQGANLIADGIDNAWGTPEHQRIRIPTIPSPDWSRNLVTEEYGTPGGWDDTHGWSKFAGGEGVMALLTAGGSKAATAVDEAGKCANWVAKFVKGGCFVSGTLVTLSELPFDDSLESQIWSSDEWYRTAISNSSTVSAKRILTPIEQVPLGARVPTKNPKPWEFDDSLPEPDQDEWLKISITVERTDGGVVDVELLRPRAWVEANGIQAGQLLPLNIAELQVAGFAHVTAIETCPVIASGDGSVITGRFVTRQVDTIARVAILGADGSIEVLEGTTIHPIWSLDRNDWVELGELQQGEQLLGQAGPATVLSVTILWSPTAVYNIEVHGEHVYEVGALGVMVHNATDECLEAAKRLGLYLEDLKIVDGVGRLRVSFTDAIKHGDIARIVDFAKSQGASSLVLDTGQVVNPKIVESIERAIAAGKPFLGGNPRFIREIPNIIPSQPPVKIFEIVFQ